MAKRLLRRRQVEGITGLPTATLYLRIKQGTFPRPYHLSARAVAWDEDEVQAWINSKLATTAGEAA